MRRALLVLVVLALLLVVADRGALYLAEREAERRVEREAGGPTAVQLHGVPFLTQLAGQRLEHVELDGDRARLRGEGADAREVTVSDVHAELYGVTRGPGGSARADTVDAVGTIPLQEAERLGGLRAGSVTSNPDGTLRVARPIAVLGVNLDASATARVRVEGRELVFDPQRVQVEGATLELDQGARAQLADRLRTRVQLPALPEGSRVEDVEVTDAGLRFRVTGEDVTLRG